MASKEASFRIVGAVPARPGPLSPAAKRSVKLIEEKVEAVKRATAPRGRRTRKAG